ncbi:MAG: hypothetical protein EOP86_06685 [Verrucomicrobiaceae bacterium]|nr:MAG: hypothetical protein EOP86_06685 [Verrucomicrobiaceae bacterium]
MMVNDTSGFDAGFEPVSLPVVPDHELLRVIGRGSYGEVWLARNVMGTPRAVKVVKRLNFDDDRPFEREFEGIQRYEPVSRTHEGLVHALHVGMGPDEGYFYYVMELGDDLRDKVPGRTPRRAGDCPDYRPRTLRDVISRQGALSLEECLETGSVLAGALGQLHRCRLVHRDVKPSNIIYVNGRPKLADAGLVAQVSDTRSMVGTDGYVAPEGTGHPRSDVFSLGRVLYECLTGLDRLKFPDVPEDWGADADSRARFELMEIVMRAGDADARRRYRDTVEMQADLALLRAGKSVRQLRRMETRLRRTMQGLALASIVVTLVGGGWALERGRRQRIETAEATARTARAETKKLLRESLVAQARSVRISGEAGARAQALSAAVQAREQGADPLEVRTQAASALGLLGIGKFSAPWPPGHYSGQFTVVSPDGNSAACGFENGRCRLFRREAGDSVVTGTVVDPQFPSAAELFLSNGGRWLAVKGRDGRFAGFDTKTGQRLWEVPPEEEGSRLDFSRDASWAVMGTRSGLTAIECATGHMVPVVPGMPPLRSVNLAPDGTWLAVLTTKENGFRIVSGLPGRMPENPPPVKVDLIESDIELLGPSISADGRYMAAAVSEDRMRVWEMPSRQQTAWLRGHQRTVRGTAFHPWDSSILASTGYDGTTRLWNIPTRQQILVAPAGGESVIFAPERGELLLRSWSGDSVRSAPLQGKAGMRVLMLPAGLPLGLFSGVAFSPDGRLLAASGDAGVIVWVLATGQIQRQELHFRPDGTLEAGPSEDVRQGKYREMAWLENRLAVANGLYPAEGAKDGRISLIDPGTGDEEVLTVPHFADTVALSRDGRWLASASFGSNVGSFIDLRSPGREARTVSFSARSTLAFLPFQPALAIGSDHDITFQMLPGQHGGPPAPLTRAYAEFIPSRFAVTPDASLMAVSTNSTEVSLFEGRTMTRLAALESPLTPFDFCMAFSADGRQLAMAGGVSRVVIWDIGWLGNELARSGLGW